MTDAASEEESEESPDGLPFDRAQLLGEIDEEVARRRASGELPREMERELDRAFAELAPVDAVDATFDTLVAKIERAAVIDLRPSLVSAYPGAAQAKQVVAKATAFYVRHVATQASSLFQGVARALRLLGERIDELEDAAGGSEGARWRELAGLVGTDSAAGARSDRAPDGVWDAFVVEQLKSAPATLPATATATAPAPATSPRGRVVHGNAGDGGLVRRLVDAGFDAYGVEPSPDVARAATDVVPDIRAVAMVEHLRTLPEGSLGGLVLSGLVEQLDLAAVLELTALAATRLRPDAVVVVLSAHPDAWVRSGPPLVVDLAPGRPLHPETWQALLGRAGFVEPVTQLGSRPQLAAVASEGSSEWAVGNDNFARLADAVFRPSDFAVSARRPR